MGESWLFICARPPSNHQTSWRYNHLILHHYGLSNFIKPHTWFWLCCSATTFPPLLLLSFLPHLYRTASVDVLLLKHKDWSLGSDRRISWTSFLNAPGKDLDLLDPFELMSRLRRPSALGWLWPGLGVGCGAMKSSSLSQRSLIHRENLCLTAGFFCPQLFPPGVRSLVLQTERSGATFLGQESG